MENFSMIDVGDKAVTVRRAVAEGRLSMGKAAFLAVKAKRLPKGDALAMAEVAGVMAAKRTSELLPLCHPLPLDRVTIRCTPEEETLSVRVECEAKAQAKTGVEMEALTGVSIALLTIYDLVKAVDPALTVSDIRLVRKEGGKSDRGTGLNGASVAVITLSDRVSSGHGQDTAGPLLVQFLNELGGKVVSHQVLADDRPAIVYLLKQQAKLTQLILLTGGTGLSPRDVTPEAVEEACDRLIPGIGEVLRQQGSSHTERAWLSRQVAGMIGQCLVIALPGSENAVRQSLPTLGRLLPHALHIGLGGDHAPVR